MSYKVIPGKAAFMARAREQSALKKKALEIKNRNLLEKMCLHLKAGDALTSKFDGRIHQVTKINKSKIYYSENPDGSGVIHSDAHAII